MAMAVACHDATGIITSCVISNNWNAADIEEPGGGLGNCNGVISNCVISGNRAAYKGGGLFACDANIINCLIVDNTVGVDFGSGGFGGGLAHCDGAIINCTIANNDAHHGDYIWSNSYGGGLYNCNGKITNCAIWGNTAETDGNQIYLSSVPNYSCIQDWIGGGIQNTYGDPLFLDPNNSDYHISSTSPCINAGDPNGNYVGQFDIDDAPRVIGERVDIGADEFNSIHNITQNTFHITIQEAIDYAATNDIIVVAPGTYYENINFNGKNITLTGLDPNSSDVVASTIIDGNQIDSVVTFSGIEDANCLLTGFTITNGLTDLTYDYKGGGINGANTHATINRCIIKENFARVGGGIWGCSGLISDCEISENGTPSQDSGGGLKECSGTIIGCIIKRNHGGWYGGGLMNCNGSVVNCIICDNTSGAGGAGLYSCNGVISNCLITGNINTGRWFEAGGGLVKCNGSINNCTITNNSAAVGWRPGEPGASYGGGLYQCNAFITNCIIWGNKSYYDPQISQCSVPSYGCIQDWTDGGTGNINTDPCFIDPCNADYNLLPGSHCIDGGNNTQLLSELYSTLMEMQDSSTIQLR